MPRACLLLPPLMMAMLAIAGSPFANAAERPPVAPDQPQPNVTASRISAIIVFGLPALAQAIEKDIPRRLTTINDRISCVHRRVLGFEVNATCDVTGYVERSGGVLLRGEGDHIIGAMPVFGTASVRGTNNLTDQLRASSEGRMTVQAEARPQLRHDWSLDLHFTDGFHWNQPPTLQILGHQIDLSRFVEPKIRSQLDRLRIRATAFAQGLDLHGKAAEAWRHAFEPMKLAESPDVWLQMRPQSVAFAGIRANPQSLEGALELQTTLETFVGQTPASVPATPLPPLGNDVAAPGKFEVIIPVRIPYETLRQKIQEAVTTLAASGAGDKSAANKDGATLRSVEVYPSSGKIIVALHFAEANAGPDAGDWIYLSAMPKNNVDEQSLQLDGLSVIIPEHPSTGAVKWLQDSNITERLKQQIHISYKQDYESLLAAANEKLTRPLGDRFRMQGRVASASLDRILLLQDGVTLQLRASGTLKILYEP